MCTHSGMANRLLLLGLIMVAFPLESAEEARTAANFASCRARLACLDRQASCCSLRWPSALRVSSILTRLPPLLLYAARPCCHQHPSNLRHWSARRVNILPHAPMRLVGEHIKRSSTQLQETCEFLHQKKRRKETCKLNSVEVSYIVASLALAHHENVATNSAFYQSLSTIFSTDPDQKIRVNQHLIKRTVIIGAARAGRHRAVHMIEPTLINRRSASAAAPPPSSLADVVSSTRP